MKFFTVCIILISVTLVSGFFFWYKEERCLISDTEHHWILEIAKTPEKHARGLMYRDHLCTRCGMLFVFEKQAPQSFWMKNTLIPLDLYFYDGEGRLVDTALNMRPMSETGEPRTYTSRPAQYVLEVPA